MATFKNLQDEVSKMDMTDSLSNRIDNVLDRARINADDTCHVEKTAPAAEYDAIALATVSDILSFENDQQVAAWFAARGVQW